MAKREAKGSNSGFKLTESFLRPNQDQENFFSAGAATCASTGLLAGLWRGFILGGGLEPELGLGLELEPLELELDPLELELDPLELELDPLELELEPLELELEPLELELEPLEPEPELKLELLDPLEPELEPLEPELEPLEPELKLELDPLELELEKVDEVPLFSTAFLPSSLLICAITFTGIGSALSK